MYEWLHWAIFDATFDGLDQLSEARKVLLEECMEMIEKRAGVQIPDGSNPSAKPMTLTLDPVNVVGRPLIWYLGVALSNIYQRRHFKNWWGCSFGTYNGLEYAAISLNVDNPIAHRSTLIRLSVISFAFPAMQSMTPVRLSSFTVSDLD